MKKFVSFLLLLCLFVACSSVAYADNGDVIWKRNGEKYYEHTRSDELIQFTDELLPLLETDAFIEGESFITDYLFYYPEGNTLSLNFDIIDAVKAQDKNWEWYDIPSLTAARITDVILGKLSHYDYMWNKLVLVFQAKKFHCTIGFYKSDIVQYTMDGITLRYFEFSADDFHYYPIDK